MPHAKCVRNRVQRGEKADKGERVRQKDRAIEREKEREPASK